MQNTQVKFQEKVIIHNTGSPDNMQYEKSAMPTPHAGEVLIQVQAAGINYIDIYMRTGLYPQPLPLTLGLEGAGTVIAVGSQVSHIKMGDRVAWCDVMGSYASHVIAPADRLISLPDELTFQQGAAAMLQGITVNYLTHDTYSLKSGDTCLVHAAAGGVGLLLCQVGKLLGAHVIGTVSTPAKAKLAREAGADDVILYTQQDFSQEVNRITDGKGVDVVYDSVGADTFEKNLQCLKIRGLLVSFGQASGVIPPLDLSKLAARSLFLTRASLFHHIITREDLVKHAGSVFNWLISGKIKLNIEHVFPLAQAAEAHRLLEGRKTTGKILLVPE